MNSTSEINDLIKELYTKAYIGKSNHYFAASRNRLLNTFTGLPAIIINIILGSILFVDLSVVLPDIIKWTGALVAFFAAFLSGIQTFFNYQRNFEAHRKVAGMLLKIQDHCNYLHKRYNDNVINIQTAYEELKEINDEYFKIISDAEAFPTKKRDYKKSIKQVQRKRKNDPNGLLK